MANTCTNSNVRALTTVATPVSSGTAIAVSSDVPSSTWIR